MPTYRLQTVLEMRERAEEAAKQAFGEATRALAKAQAELERLEADLVKRREERRAKVAAYLDEIMAKGATGPTALTRMQRFEERLKAEEAEVALEIERQKDVVKTAQEHVELKRQEMAEAAKEKKAIEKHKEKWAAEVKKTRDDREQLAQEEIGSALFLARQRG
jgi:flagellar export protein FliJ